MDDFAVHGVMCTCTIKTFMKDICGHETYRPFIGNTYYEFVQEEQLSDRCEVILMHNVVREFDCTEVLIIDIISLLI